MFFITWRIMPGFLRRHPGIHLLLLGIGIFIGLGLVLAAFGVGFDSNPNAQINVPVPTPAYIKLTDGAYYYLPADLRNDPVFNGAKYVWIPPAMTLANPHFCTYMDSAYYRQPTPEQTSDYDANCPNGQPVGGS
jgi:hypothetical protein